MLILVFIILCVILVLAITRLFFMTWRDNMLFAPINQTVYKPTGKNIDFMIDCETGPIHAQYHYISKGAPVVVYFHGTNANLSCRKYVVDMTNVIKCNLLLVDYSGYGKAPGYPSLDAIACSGKAAVDWLVTYGYKRKEIRIWAESIGSVAAARIARDMKCHSIVNLFGVPSFQAIMASSDKAGGKIAAKISSYFLPKETNEECFAKTKTKIIFLHSSEDNLIPYKSAVKAESNVPRNMSGGMITIKGGHSTPIITKEQMIRVLKFMEIYDPNKLSDAELEMWLKDLSTMVTHDMKFRINDFNKFGRS